MTRLQQVGSFFAREHDFQPVLERIVDAAIAISRADFGNIQLLDLDSDLKIAAQRGFPQWYVDFWNEVTAGSGTCGSALAAGRRVIVPDVEQSPVFGDKPGLEMQRRAGGRCNRLRSSVVGEKFSECSPRTSRNDTSRTNTR